MSPLHLNLTPSFVHSIATVHDISTVILEYCPGRYVVLTRLTKRGQISADSLKLR